MIGSIKLIKSHGNSYVFEIIDIDYKPLRFTIHLEDGEEMTYNKLFGVVWQR